MFKEKFYYFIDADNVRPSRLPFELLPPQNKIYIVGNNNGKQVHAWKTLLEEKENIILETKVVSSRPNEADYHLIHKIYQTAESVHKKNKRFCIVLATADRRILEASRYVCDVLVQFSSANQAGNHGIADFVLFTSPATPNINTAPLIEELAKILSPSVKKTQLGDIIISAAKVVELLKKTGIISKEQEKPLKWILQNYSSVFSGNNEKFIIKRNADAEAVKNLLEKFKSYQSLVQSSPPESP